MIKVVRSCKMNNTFWKEMPEMKFGEYNPADQCVVVDTSELFQTHLGFGGAFTEAAAHTLSFLTPEKRQEVIRAYFDPVHGLGYNLGRMAVHSCDFALGNYTYVTEGDMSLDSFDMSREDKWTVPLVLDAQKAAGRDLMIFAAPWSPPAYMKTNCEMNLGGKLKPEFRKLWAAYLLKFVRGMNARGVKIFALNTQNEPEAVQRWDSCNYTAEDERDFCRELAAQIEKEKLPLKIIIWDHNRDRMIERARIIYNDPICNKAVWGTGYHWYVSADHNNLSVHKMLFKDKHIVFTEGCVELTNMSNGGTYIGNYKNAEFYGRNIINDFNNFNEGFIDWNLVLDHRGGPNHVDNFCEAPVMVNTENGSVTYNPSFYYIGHFSKYIKPGARRVLCNHSAGSDVFATAFVNPDKSVAVVIQNQGWIKQVSLMVDGKGVNATLADNSITTYIIPQLH